VLVLSQTLRGILLTGDSNLRYCGEQSGVEVRGTLWIFDQLVEEKLLPRREAARLLEKLVREGRRFPSEACEQRIQLWRGLLDWDGGH
jgi:predicted nucleic acid-binding protein